MLQEELFGVVERITFRSTDTGFTVGWLKPPRSPDPVQIVGTMPELQPGESVRCKGMFRHHPQHGAQFQVQEYYAALPTDTVGMQRFLESGMIRGIGKKLAERIVDHFGNETLGVFERSLDRLTEIEGIGPKKLERIRSSWTEQTAVREVMIFLQGHGVTAGYAHKIYRKYGDQAIVKVQENPYRLAVEVSGFGFRTADQIAAKLGIAPNDPQRIRAGLEFALESLSHEGHTCAPREHLLHTAEQMLAVPFDALLPELQWLLSHERIVQEEREGVVWIWTRFHWACELGIVREIDRLLGAPCRFRSIDLDKALEWVQGVLALQLAEGQAAAVRAACSERFLILTGGPGTGKSTITRALLTILSKLSGRIALAAPTGRAAKRLAEVTGFGASTLHSLLEIDFVHGGFKRGRDYPLECDLLVVDEASMVDSALMLRLLQAIPSGARVILVGDVDQLPSVGPGTVLADLIDSGLIPVSRLQDIFRQAAGSRIITSAHAIHRGDCPDLKWEAASDFLFYPEEDPERLVQKLLELVSRSLPQVRQLDPIMDIQVLAPMKRGVLGTENLNVALQRVLNPSKQPPLVRMGRSFLPGDKVMQIRNDYQKGVFNGDVGRILSIDSEEQQLCVRFDDREVDYEFAELDELVLAYAVSVHKYQGSEVPCVVMPVHMTHYRMLQRQLLYTGVTRGKRCVVLMGAKKAIRCACEREDVGRRMTGLASLLRGKGGQPSSGPQTTPQEA